MFTLSGGHVFPLYDGAVKADPPLRLVDVRHEQTAVFAAEATARLTRAPGLAVVTAGPGVTNSVSAVTSAWFNGAPLVVLGGRAPDYLWGKGALQEMDHVPLLAPVTKRAWTEHDTPRVAASVDEAFRLATTPHRGPVFFDFPLEAIYGEGEAELPDGALSVPAQPDPADVARIAALLATARRPVLVLGSDVWLGGADVAARPCAEALRLPVIANGQARGVLPGGHSLLVSRARSLAFAEADLVIVAGVPLDFRLRYGSFGPKESPASVVHVADSPGGIATHCPLAASASGDLSLFFTALTDEAGARPAGDMEWLARLRGAARAAAGRGRPAAGERRRRRSTRCASTASCCASSTTTRWSSATAATSSPSRAASSSRRCRAGGSTRVPTAAWAPASATRSRPGSRTRRPRWCCCSATARLGCR